MRARAVLIPIALLLLAGCASGPTRDTVRDALEDVGVDVTYVRLYESRDTDWWIERAEVSEIGLDLANCYAPSIGLYEFSTEQEASEAAQGELPGGPQEAQISWVAQPHVFQRGRLVAMVGFMPLSSQLDERETAAMEADVARVLEVLEDQMGAEVPYEDWSQ